MKRRSKLPSCEIRNTNYELRVAGYEITAFTLTRNGRLATVRLSFWFEQPSSESPAVIVVTGASGFIGSNAVRELNRRGENRIVAVDDYPWLRHCHQLTRRCAAARYSAQMRVAGFVDLHRLVDWLEREGDAVSSILHLGACSDTMVTDRDWIMQNNCAYTQSLWRWCAKAGRPFIYASSAATYGDGSRGYDDGCDPAQFRPLNYYGESKHLFDLWALSQAKAPPAWAGLKYFNVYGPREDHKGRMASVVFHGFRQVLDTGSICLFESLCPTIAHGDQQRDFIYVRDVVRATLHFLAPETRFDSGLYNVGTGVSRTFNQLARAIFTALEREPRIEYFPMPQDLRGRYQHFTQATISKLRQAGFLEAMTSLEDGVRDYVHDYLMSRAIAA